MLWVKENWFLEAEDLSSNPGSDFYHMLLGPLFPSWDQWGLHLWNDYNSVLTGIND